MIAIGIDQDGKRDVLDFDVEAEVHWRSFLKSLMQRLTGLKMVASDAHTGLKAAMRAGQRCQFHLQKMPVITLAKKISRKLSLMILEKYLTPPIEQRQIKYTKELILKYEKRESKLTRWLEENMSVFGLGLSEFNLKHLRTNNVLERLNQTIKKRTRVAKIFPNIESCSRLIGPLYA